MIFDIASNPFHIGDRIYITDSKSYATVIGLDINQDYFNIRYVLDSGKKSDIPFIYCFKSLREYEEIMHWLMCSPRHFLHSEYQNALSYESGIPRASRQIFSGACSKTLIHDMFGCAYSRELPERSGNVPYDSYDEINSLLWELDMKSAIIYITSTDSEIGG